MKTLCGTLSYVAPEILLAQDYNNKIDCWSLGVVTFLMISGYQPFQDGSTGDGDISKKEAIINGHYNYSFKGIQVTSACKSFVSSLLQICPKQRISSKLLPGHEWLKMDCGDNEEHDTHEVFFMIGSQ